MIQGIDISYDDLSYDEAVRLKAAGVGAVFQCLWTGSEQPPPRVTNLRNAYQAGLIIGGYISITASMAGRWHVQQGRAGVPGDLWDALVKVVVDVELPSLTLDMCVDAIQEVHLNGKARDIYTSYNQWANVMGNPDNLRNCGLWNAYWDGDPDADFPHLPFGGWKPDEVWGEQWSGGANVQGVFADRDTFDERAFSVAPAPEPTPAPLSVKARIQIALNAAYAAVNEMPD